MVWASGFASPSKEELHAVKQEVLFLFNQYHGQGAARVLVFEHLGWELEPFLPWTLPASRSSGGSTRPRLNGWTLPTCAFAKWNDLFPRAQAMLTRLGWRLTEQCRQLSKLDDLGRRRCVEVGVDSFKCVRQWFFDHYRKLYVRRAGSVVQAYQRENPQLARGMCLPAPPAEHTYAFAGHRICGEEVQNQYLRNASAVTSGSCWHLNAGGDFPHDHLQWKCMCGGAQPSGAHITWVCQHTRVLRYGHDAATNPAEERLFCKHMHFQPPAPPATGLEDFSASVSQALAQSLSRSPGAYVATDGGSKFDVGAFSVVVGDEEVAFAAGDSSEDQNPFKQKLNAKYYAAKAMFAAAQHGAKGHVTLISDCQAALAVVEVAGKPHASCLPNSSPGHPELPPSCCACWDYAFLGLGSVSREKGKVETSWEPFCHTFACA